MLTSIGSAKPPLSRIGWTLGLVALLWAGWAWPDSTGIAALGDTVNGLQEQVRDSRADSQPGAAFIPPRADQDTSGGRLAGGAEISYWALITKLGMGLALVVLLVWGLVFLLRRSGLGQQLSTGGGTVRVVERVYLGPKKAIYLVEIGDRILALGITEENIAPLAEWRAGELEIASRAGGPGPLAAQFRNLLGQFRKGAPAPEEQR